MSNTDELEQMTSYDKVKSWLTNVDMRKTLRRTLPEKIETDPWIELALVHIRTDEKVMNCTPMSIMGALMNIASMGLRLEGALGQAYLEAYAVKKWNSQTRENEITHYEAQAQVGYRGLIDIVYRDPEILDVEVFMVYANDIMEHQRGSKPFINHSWDHRSGKKSRGKIAALVTGLRYKNGYYSFEIYPFEDIIEHRNKVLLQKGIRVEENEGGDEIFIGKKYGNKGEYAINPMTTMNPWIKYELPMFKKTGIRWSAKYWNLSPDVQRAAQLSALEDAGVSQGNESLARAVLPSQVRVEAEQDLPNSGRLAPAQGASIARNNNLAQQMAEEATKRTSGGTQGVNSVAGTGAKAKQGKPNIGRPAATQGKNNGKATTVAKRPAAKGGKATGNKNR